MNARQDATAYLEGARPFPRQNRFILGTFERGITLYRQQIRALNLVYSFVNAKDVTRQPMIPPACRIVIVGGGAFGVTVAVAAAYAGFRVSLLERHQTLLHLQRGCDTRWLHPRFYDWPAPESESEMSRLPFLDWTASNAGRVAAQIEEQISTLRTTELSGRLSIDLGISSLTVAQTPQRLFEVQYRSNASQTIRTCEVVVYAVGFGIEINHGSNESYWRNDRYGQSDLSFTSRRIQYVISGFGDGALVDLFRLTIRDFRYEQIFGQMFPSLSAAFEGALDHLRKTCGTKEGSLYDGLDAIENGRYRKVIRDAKEELVRRLRTDTSVTLNARAPSFRQGLSLEKASFSNALLAYLLFRVDGMTYRRGEIDTRGTKPRLSKPTKKTTKPTWLKQAAHVIIRHGTSRVTALTDVGCGGAIRYLRSRAGLDTGQQIYPAGWWGRYVDPSTTRTSATDPTPVEFVPPQLRSHATTFVSTLADILGFLIDRRQRRRPGVRRRKFRVTLHRLTRFEHREVFQQVTPYKGTSGSTSGVGRFFPVTSGIVGVACRTGSLVVARKTNAKSFRSIWDLTDLPQSGAKNIKPYVDSLLCCPFFAPPAGDGVDRVSLALFVDSADARFFSDEVLQTISFACRGFVDLLESLYEERMLRALGGRDTGFIVRRTRDVTRLQRQLTNLGVRFIDPKEKGWKEGLTFRRLRSLDLQAAI